MDPQVQASFIPQKSLEMTSTRGGGFGGLLFLISLLIFIASLVAAGADAVAIITDVVNAPDIGVKVRSIVALARN